MGSPEVDNMSLSVCPHELCVVSSIDLQVLLPLRSCVLSSLSQAKCQLNEKAGVTCTCPDGYAGDGTLCYGSLQDVSIQAIPPSLHPSIHPSTLH